MKIIKVKNIFEVVFTYLAVLAILAIIIYFWGGYDKLNIYQHLFAILVAGLSIKLEIKEVPNP
ncbi:hypothetical protein ACFL6S_00740 [Candidatus Poribacteria bacterium]